MTTTATKPKGPKITAIASWFGSNRTLAHEVGQTLAGCEWVGVPFAGGMCELLHIDARTMLVSDVHRHVINLARVVADDELRQLAVGKLNRVMPFHPDRLDEAQRKCWDNQPGPSADWELAVEYFITIWMGRSHKAGTKDEFNGSVSLRWNANGGDSNVRFRSAVRSLAEWSRIVKRCNFCVMDCFDFLDRCEDASGHGIYCDPPFPGPGDKYKHKFTIADHKRLASRLAKFQETRIVCRFYDHPLVRELYPEPQWTWLSFSGRNQVNDETPERLIVRNMPTEGGMFK